MGKSSLCVRVSLSGSHVLLKLGVKNQFSLHVRMGVCTRGMDLEEPDLPVAA